MRPGIRQWIAVILFMFVAWVIGVVMGSSGMFSHR
jgi:hypothetical protein